MTIFFYGDTRNRYDADEFARELARIAETGVNLVVLVPYWFEENARSSVMRPTTQTISDDDFAAACRQVVAHGLSLGVKPHVDLEDGAFRSTINPADWSRWSSAYLEFLEHYARIAQTAGASLFCVGTELTGVSPRTSYWREVISQCRTDFDGLLTYAANPQESLSIEFWDDLDLIGIDAYFPVSRKDDPELHDLLFGWGAWAQMLEDLAHEYDKKVLLTEIGYRNVHGAAADPGNYSRSGERDDALQADLYRAALLATGEIDVVAGLVWWQWELNGVGAFVDTDYTPRGKQAEDVLKELWSR